MNFEMIKAKLLKDVPDFSGVISLTIDGKIQIREALGESILSAHVPNRVTTRFAIASGCKVFTAVSILKLVEMGKLSLNTSIAECLPGLFPHMDSSVTVYHLLTHTSGFADYFDEEADGDYEKLWQETSMYLMKRPMDFLMLLQNNKMEFEPGSRFKYNNGCFIILSMIVEKYSGMVFSDFVQKYIFDACGMKSSGYFYMDKLPEDTAISYTKDEDGSLKSNIYCVPIVGGGDGGAYTTAEDMNAFWNALIEGKLLLLETVKEMCIPRVKTGESSDSYGLGVWLNTSKGKVTKIHVMGMDPGVSFRSIYYPDTKAVCTVLCNRDSGAFAAVRAIEELI